MMNKMLGYILSLVGIAGLAVAMVPQLQKTIALPADLTKEIYPSVSILLIGSIIVLAVGLFFVVKGKGGSRQASEVPIYHGKNVVGYRRMK